MCPLCLAYFTEDGVAPVSSAFLFKAEWHCTVCISLLNWVYPHTCWRTQVLSAFWVLWLCSSEHGHTSICVRPCIQFLQVERPKSGTAESYGDSVSTAAAQVHTPTGKGRGSFHSFPASPTLSIFHPLYHSHPGGVSIPPYLEVSLRAGEILRCRFHFAPQWPTAQVELRSSGMRFLTFC